jgi:hypothetical protein
LGREPILRKLFAFFLAAHGIAHVVGFAVSWKLTDSDDLAYTTELFGGLIDAGSVGIRIVGVIWLLGAAAFVAAALLLWQRSQRAMQALLGATLLSTLLCLARPREAWIGLVIDLVLLAGIAAVELRLRRQLAS